MNIGTGYKSQKEINEAETEQLISWLASAWSTETKKARSDEQRIANELEKRIGISAEKLLVLLNK